jgi:hypothetical protein
MSDDIRMYRLINGELIVAEFLGKGDSDYTLKLGRPHSLSTQEQGRINLQPSIPHEEGEGVDLYIKHILFSSTAPDNIKKGYRQALSNIIMPDMNQGLSQSLNPRR